MTKESKNLSFFIDAPMHITRELTSLSQEATELCNAEVRRMLSGTDAVHPVATLDNISNMLCVNMDTTSCLRLVRQCIRVISCHF